MNASDLRGGSNLEREFLLRWAAHCPDVGWQREHRFDPSRRWRFDFACPAARVAVEIEGGIWSGGRHTRGVGFISDCEKYNAAAAAGWSVFRLPDELLTREQLQNIHKLIQERTA